MPTDSERRAMLNSLATRLLSEASRAPRGAIEPLLKSNPFIEKRLAQLMDKDEWSRNDTAHIIVLLYLRLIATR